MEGREGEREHVWVEDRAKGMKKLMWSEWERVYWWVDVFV